jgi:DMSO/TMAO reductase YedYZ molybdopterin-dependent catalytic subunit
MITSSPSWRATSTVSSRDTSSTRMILWIRACGMSAYVRSRVSAALYAGMTMTIRGSAGWATARSVAGRRDAVGPHYGHGIVTGIVRPLATQPASKDPRTMFERLFGDTAVDAAIAERIPPGQYKTEKFPVLHYGSVPRTDLATWDFKVWGEVDALFTLTWQQFKELPRKQLHTDIHCVTRWSKLDTDWEGVAIQTILELAQVRPSATHVVSHAEQGYTANLPLDVLDDEDVILADTYGGEPLEPEHGYPLRLVVPKRYFWKSSKWIRGLEFLDHDQLGFWERYGYNNDADPWKEERFSD